MDTPRTVFLHVGAPKTGTSQLQDLLFLNRATLAAKGVLYPADRFDTQFLAALDLLGKRWGGLESEAVGSWGRLVEQASTFCGTVIVSHEVFAGASSEQAARALSELAGEVHVVYSVRDLARQIPAEWQEGVKHRRQLTYAEFCADLVQPKPQTPMARWFWSVQDWPDVLRRWGATLPPDRVHVVTVPGPDAPRELLIERFLTLFGIDPAWLPMASERSNASLGGAEATVIRRINERLPVERLEGPVYRHYVREKLVHSRLAPASSSPRITLPPSLDGWAAERSAEWTAQLRRADYDVVGDLAEVEPPPVSQPWQDPDAPAAERELDVAYDVIETLLLEIQRLEQALARATSAPDRSPGTGAGPRQRVKQRLIVLSGRYGMLAWARGRYRALRRRS
ncbi:MAG: hypothetical protein ACR2KL_13500 [Nocardioidaceae bacterium]